MTLMPDPDTLAPAPAPETAPETAPPLVSVVVPLRDEEANLRALVAGISAALSPLCDHEIVLVDDASTDATLALARDLAAGQPGLRVLAHDRPGGQSAAVHSGVRAARGPIIATLDGDGQNPPENLPALLAPLLAQDADPALALVAGQRVGRRDTASKRLASWLANRLRRAVLRDATRDTGCGLKAFRRAAYLALPYFDHQHRYLPALFLRDGWQIAHVQVSHAPRLHGRSKYTNLHRALVGATDLLGVVWLIARRKRARAQEIAAAPIGRV